MKKADRLKKARVPARQEEHGNRLPPGQTLTQKFPILHEGEIPTYDMSEWNFKIFGEIEEAKTFSYQDILQLPQTKLIRDIHCVTRWSKFDNEFEGVKVTDFLKAYDIKINPEAKYVMVHGDFDYDTNLPIEEFLKDDILLAHSYNGEALTPQHGWPLRLLVPHLYFWKSAKWIRGFEFMKEDRPGFWERNGFHNEADPFKEERFSDEDSYMPEDEWHSKDYD